jgi:hypothetical protein
MFEQVALQNPSFNYVDWNGEYLFASQNHVKVWVRYHPQALPHQRFSVKSEYKEYGASYSCGNKRSETSYRTKKTSKRFANLDKAITFALAEIS